MGWMRRLLLLGSVWSVLAAAQTPVVADGGVVNAASFAREPVAPGSLVSIFGSELASALAQADSIPLSTSLGGVSVLFNDIAAPLLFVSGGQINAQLPWSVISAESGEATVVVTRGGVVSAQRAFQVRRTSPGIFALSGGMAVAVNADDGTLAQPEGAVPGIRSEPARIGRAVILYANGLGPVNPPIASGEAAGSTLRTNTLTPTILVGGREVQPLFSGLAPQFVGVNQINFIVPEGVTPGSAVPLQIRVGEQTTPSTVTIAVRN